MRPWPRWSSTRSAARSSRSPSRPPASASAARPCCRTSPSSPAARSSPRRSVSSSRTSPSTCWARPAVTVTKDETTIVEGAGSEVELKGRIAQIKAEIDNTDSDYDRGEAPGAPGQAVRWRGDHQGRRRHRGRAQGEEAPHRGRGQHHQGRGRGGCRPRWRRGPAACPGHGRSSWPPTLDGDEATGALIVARALEEPLKQIAINAGMEGGVVVERVRNLDGADGLNAATGEYEDLFKAGVIDAAKVTRSALQNAASIAAPLPHHRGSHRRPAGQGWCGRRR